MKINVIVHTCSKFAHIKKDEKGMYHTYIHEPPVQGKANKAVIQILATYFKVKRSDVLLTKGEKSKQKTFVVLKPRSNQSSQ